MSERKLATIEVIKELRPIENADKIEVAIVKGWECVVKKGEFKVDEKIIYVEVDSVMSERPEFEFLRERKFRVRTIKLRGQISQGLVLPIHPTLNQYSKTTEGYSIGEDVTDLLGITKYLSPSEREETEQTIRKFTKRNKLVKFMMRYSWFRKLLLPKPKKSDWPYWVAKTDEERVQNLAWDRFYEQYKDREVYVTEKIDYQSVTFTGKIINIFSWLNLKSISNYSFKQIFRMITIGKIPFIIKDHNAYTVASSYKQCQSKYTNHTIKQISWTRFISRLVLHKFLFIVCSRNMVNNDKNSLYWKIAKKYNIEQILRENPNLTIQGEQGDTKVQGNKYGITEPTMWVFNIIDHERNYHYDYKEMSIFCEKYDLNIVPQIRSDKREHGIFGYMPLSYLGSTVQELVEFSKGKSVINPKIEREGIVVRCIESGYQGYQGPLGWKIFSFKVINPDFLIKFNE